MIFDNTDFVNKFWIVLTRFICKKISKKYSQGYLSYFMTVGLSPVFFYIWKVVSDRCPTESSRCYNTKNKFQQSLAINKDTFMVQLILE